MFFYVNCTFFCCPTKCSLYCCPTISTFYAFYVICIDYVMLNVYKMCKCMCKGFFLHPIRSRGRDRFFFGEIVNVQVTM